jgi:prefoldin subunit 5
MPEHKTDLQVVRQPKKPKAKSPTAVLRTQLASLNAALKKAEAHYWSAINSLASDGVGVLVDVGDSNGKTHKKLRVNPAVRVQREAERTIEELKEKIAALKNELAQLEGDNDGWSTFNSAGKDS